jgi:predicted phosphodiesterase
MNILVIGDLHFKAKRLHFMERVVDEIMSLIEGVSLVVCLGDVLDTHEKINMMCLRAAVDLFLALAEKVRTVVLIGNHDRRNNSDFMSRYHPFVGVTHKNLLIVDQTTRDPEFPFLYVPYVPPGMFAKSFEGHFDLKNLDKKSPRLIFAHQEFKGAQMGAIKSIAGDEWHDRLPLVISGHIHDYQELPGVIYTGTPVQHSYGENPDKGLLLIRIPHELVKPKVLEKEEDLGDMKVLATATSKEEVKIFDAKTFLPLISRERIALNLPRKRILHLTYEDLHLPHDEIMNLFHPTDQTKVIIHHHPEEAIKIRSLPIYQKLNQRADLVVLKCLPGEMKGRLKEGIEEKGSLEKRHEMGKEAFWKKVEQLLIDDPEAIRLLHQYLRPT